MLLEDVRIVSVRREATHVPIGAEPVSITSAGHAREVSLLSARPAIGVRLRRSAGEQPETIETYTYLILGAVVFGLLHTAFAVKYGQSVVAVLFSIIVSAADVDGIAVKPGDSIATG